ncbi:unnamed protein product, partial [Closterium sp. NIES-53]
VLRRFTFQYSSPQPTPLSTRHLLSAPPSDESVEPSGPYPKLVGCLMYLMMCTRPDLTYLLSLLARYVAPGRHRKGPVVLTVHSDASWADDQATRHSSQGYTFSLGSDSVSWRSTRSSSVLGSSREAEIYAGALREEKMFHLEKKVQDIGARDGKGCTTYRDYNRIAMCRTPPERVHPVQRKKERASEEEEGP